MRLTAVGTGNNKKETEQRTESAWSRRTRTRNPPSGLGFSRFQGVHGAEICLEQADPDPKTRRSTDFPLQPFLHQTPRASARGVILGVLGVAGAMALVGSLYPADAPGMSRFESSQSSTAPPSRRRNRSGAAAGLRTWFSMCPATSFLMVGGLGGVIISVVRWRLAYFEFVHLEPDSPDENQSEVGVVFFSECTGKQKEKQVRDTPQTDGVPADSLSEPISSSSTREGAHDSSDLVRTSTHRCGGSDPLRGVAVERTCEAKIGARQRGPENCAALNTLLLISTSSDEIVRSPVGNNLPESSAVETTTGQVSAVAREVDTQDATGQLKHELPPANHHRLGPVADRLFELLADCPEEVGASAGLELDPDSDDELSKLDRRRRRQRLQHRNCIRNRVSLQCIFPQRLRCWTTENRRGDNCQQASSANRCCTRQPRLGTPETPTSHADPAAYLATGRKDPLLGRPFRGARVATPMSATTRVDVAMGNASVELTRKDRDESKWACGTHGGAGARWMRGLEHADPATTNTKSCAHGCKDARVGASAPRIGLSFLQDWLEPGPVAVPSCACIGLQFGYTIHPGGISIHPLIGGQFE